MTSLLFHYDGGTPHCGQDLHPGSESRILIKLPQPENLSCISHTPLPFPLHLLLDIITNFLHPASAFEEEEEPQVSAGRVSASSHHSLSFLKL